MPPDLECLGGPLDGERRAALPNQHEFALASGGTFVFDIGQASAVSYTGPGGWYRRERRGDGSVWAWQGG